MLIENNSRKQQTKNNPIEQTIVANIINKIALTLFNSLKFGNRIFFLEYKFPLINPPVWKKDGFPSFISLYIISVQHQFCSYLLYY